MAQLRDRLGRFGIWRGAFQVTAQLAAAVEECGFGALWLGGSPGGDLAQLEELLGAICAESLHSPSPMLVRSRALP